MLTLLLAAQLAAATSVPLYASSPGLQRRAAGGAMLDSMNSDYTPLVDVQVGTPPQTVRATLDVNSGLSVIGGSPYAGGAFYPPSSSSLKEGDKVKDYELSDGRKTNGVRATDKIAVGTVSLTTDFVLANPSGPNGPEAPGINNAFLGLGYKDAPNPALSSVWDQKLWGLYLAPRSLKVSGQAGETKRIGSLSLGRVDASYADGEPDWLDLIDKESGRWAVGFYQAGLQPQTGRNGVMDSQYFPDKFFDVAPVPGIGLPPVALDKMMSAIDGAKKWTQDGKAVWTVPCDNKLKLTLGLLHSSLGSNNNTADFVIENDALVVNEGSQCRTVFTSTEGRPWLGLPFLSSVYSVWDLEKSRIGFAKVKSGSRIDNSEFANATAPARESAQPTTTGKEYPLPKDGHVTGAASSVRPTLAAMALAALAAVLI